MNELLVFWLANPSNVLFLALLSAIAWIGWRAQRERDDVDFADVLRDDAGKITWSRFAAIGSFLASTWAITSYAALKILTVEMLGVYLAVWSGTAVALKALDIWAKKP